MIFYFVALRCPISIIFDLDGVLVESKDLHYHSLNRALEHIDPKYVIPRNEHLSTYDGLSTTKKLHILTEYKGLPKNLYDEIWKLKQDMTLQWINETFTYDQRIRYILKTLKDRGYLIYVASNSIYNSVKLMLLKKGFLEYIDYFISNEDVVLPKPHPEMYYKCVIRAKVNPYETIIVEDSHIGRKAALSSGCHLFPVDNPNCLTLKSIEIFINKMDKKEYKVEWNGKRNVLIPMAGAGSRFAKAGYTFPKPLIEVHGKPMIQTVVENLNLNRERAQFIFIVQKTHYEQYNLQYLLNLIAPDCKIEIVDDLTEGAACSALLAKEYINNDVPLLFANSDQYLEWDSNEFMYSMIADEVDGGISTFENSHPKWSYAKLNDHGFVSEVAEKKPISNHATTGIYYWKRGSDFVKYAEQMIKKDIRVNGEFYVCPVFNEAIQDGKKIKIMNCKKMWGLGTPEDLDYYLKTFNT